MSLTPQALKFVASLCPHAFSGVDDEQLGDILDAWLADQFALEDHVHIHSWDDAERGDDR